MLVVNWAEDSSIATKLKLVSLMRLTDLHALAILYITSRLSSKFSLYVALSHIIKL